MSLSDQAIFGSSTRNGYISEDLACDLFRRLIVIAADGSIMDDGDDVYMLDVPFHLRIDRVDYFHVRHQQLLMPPDDAILYTSRMVPLGWWGNTVKRITVLQRMWRNIRWRRHLQPKLVQLSHDVVMRVHS